MSEELQRVSMTYGKVVLKNSSATLAVLRVTAPFKRESAAMVGRSEQSSKEYFQSTAYRDIGGGFTRQRVGHPEGTLIVLQSSETKRGVLHAEAAIFLRLRAGADLLSINVKLPVGPESRLGDTLQSFVGAADILTYDEVRLLGINVPRHYRDRYGNEDEIDELFEVSVVRKGNISKPQLVAVATSEGTVIKAVGTEAVRRVKIRRH
jgi:hypothetical protein